MLTLALFAFGLGTVVCSGEVDLLATPDIEYGQVICAQCGMIVSDESHAAAYRLADGDLRVFDDLGDMVLYDRLNSENVHVFWVHDFQTGDWMRAPDAYYVATDDLSTPMGHGIAAFTFEAGAEHLAGEHGAPVYRWEELRAVPLKDLPRHTE